MNSPPRLATLCEYQAQECVREAERTHDLKHREVLIRMAWEWMREASAPQRPEMKPMK
jgi:phosphoribosyl-dephospho-CoA transferase